MKKIILNIALLTMLYTPITRSAGVDAKQVVYFTSDLVKLMDDIGTTGKFFTQAKATFNQAKCPETKEQCIAQTLQNLQQGIEPLMNDLVGQYNISTKKLADGLIFHFSMMIKPVLGQQKKWGWSNQMNNLARNTAVHFASFNDLASRIATVLNSTDLSEKEENELEI